MAALHGDGNSNINANGNAHTDIHAYNHTCANPDSPTHANVVVAVTNAGVDMRRGYKWAGSATTHFLGHGNY